MGKLGHWPIVWVERRLDQAGWGEAGFFSSHAYPQIIPFPALPFLRVDTAQLCSHTTGQWHLRLLTSKAKATVGRWRYNY